MPGTPDHQVLQKAHAENVVLITEDKDFGELVYRDKKPHAGVLFLRFDDLDIATKSRVLLEAVALNQDKFPGAYSVLTVDDLRIRPASAK